jgi:uncharacterized membrane protein
VSPDRRRLSALLAILGGSGVLHLVIPGPYRKIVPPQIGHDRDVVLASGIVELGCAALLAVPSTRRLGARLSAVLFVAVFPANLYAVKVIGGGRIGRAAAIARLPLQVPLVTSALKVAREA